MTEINVTSPTGIREVKRFGGADIAALFWDAVEAQARLSRLRLCRLHGCIPFVCISGSGRNPLATCDYACSCNCSCFIPKFVHCLPLQV